MIEKGGRSFIWSESRSVCNRIRSKSMTDVQPLYLIYFRRTSMYSVDEESTLINFRTIRYNKRLDFKFFFDIL